MTCAGGSTEWSIAATPSEPRASLPVRARRRRRAGSSNRLRAPRSELPFRKERRQRWLLSASGSTTARWREPRAPAATARMDRVPLSVPPSRARSGSGAMAAMPESRRSSSTVYRSQRSIEARCRETAHCSLPNRSPRLPRTCGASATAPRPRLLTEIHIPIRLRFRHTWTILSRRCSRI